MSEPVHKTLAGALLAFQADCPTLPKDAVNPHFKSKFTSLDTIVETVRPLLQKHGLVWTTLPVADDDGRPMLEYRLVHAGHEKLLDNGSGKTFAMEPEAITGRMPLLLQKQDPQGLGSALTYARRYALSAVLNLVADEDEDGNSASQRAVQNRPGYPEAPQQPAKKRLPVTLLNELRRGYVLTGWDVPTLHRHLAQFNVKSVEDLSIEQAQELLTIMSAAVDAKNDVEAPAL